MVYGGRDERGLDNNCGGRLPPVHLVAAASVGPGAAAATTTGAALARISDATATA